MNKLPTVKPVGSTGSWVVRAAGFGELPCLHKQWFDLKTGTYRETSDKYRDGAKVARHLALLRQGKVCLTEDEWADDFSSCKRKGYCGLYAIDPDSVSLVDGTLTLRFGEKIAHCPA